MSRRDKTIPGTPGAGVLIVEDEAEIRNLFAMLLEAENYTVFQADEGEAALDLLKEQGDRIAVMITDLGLPRMGGVELISKAKIIHPGVRIVGTSGFGRENVRELVLAAGADEFISKPFNINAVLAKVRQLSTRVP